MPEPEVQQYPGKVFVSPMRRARESAAAICPERRDLIYDPRIREVDFGDWENLTFDEIQKTASPELLAKALFPLRAPPVTTTILFSIRKTSLMKAGAGGKRGRRAD